MRILFCYKNSLNPIKGGVQKVTGTLSKFFKQRGHDIYFLIHEKDTKDVIYKYAVQVYYLPDEELFSSKNIKYFHSLIDSLAIDIIINQDGSNNRSRFFLNLAGKRTAKISVLHNDPLYGVNYLVKQSSYPLIKFIKDNLPFLHYWHSVFNRRKEINFLLKNSSAVVVLSGVFIRNIKQYLFITNHKLHAIGNPIENLNYNNSKTNKKNQVLYVGRLEIKQKRPDVLLRIWSLVENRMPEWRLVLLGDGEDRAKLEKQSENLQLRNVCFKGFVDPRPYYEESLILCLTSDYEGLGMVVLEGMQYNVVPISFENWDSINEIIIDMQTGVLIRRNEINEYAEKLIELMSDESYRKRLASNAGKILSNYTIEKIGQQWLDLFENIRPQN